MTKFGIWTDTRSSSDMILHSSARAVEETFFYFELKKVAESKNGDLTFHVFSLEDKVVHLRSRNPSRMLTIQK